MGRRGTATLPLHDGSAPRWLFDRMVDLGGAIAAVVIEEYGREELLRRLSDPHWFQALGCVLGFDWHSSGLTTTTMGALKHALDPGDTGVFVAGGKGAVARRTPDEIDASSIDLSGGDRDRLIRHSRLSAKVDNACVQDCFTLYHHTMIGTEDGDWAVVQQGMDGSTARRYHWRSDELDDPVVAPQAAIATQAWQPEVLDMTAPASDEAREISVDLVQDNPAHLKRYLEPGQRSLADFGGTTAHDRPVPDLAMPARHELRLADLSERAIEQLGLAYEQQPSDYEELVGLEGVGRGSLRALALIAELVHGAETSREDPAKFAYAHGGKDGTPYPVDRQRYDRSIDFLETVLYQAELDRYEERAARDRLRALAS